MESVRHDLLMPMSLLLNDKQGRTSLSQIGMEDDQRRIPLTVFASPSHLLRLLSQEALEDLSASVPPGHIITAFLDLTSTRWTH